MKLAVQQRQALVGVPISPLTGPPVALAGMKQTQEGVEGLVSG